MDEKIKIVMIDDEEDLCVLVKENLEQTGDFEVRTTTLPEEAQAVCERENPDVILLDNVMPKYKGQDIAKALRKAEATKRIPIIVVSGKGEMVYNKKKQQFQWLPNNPMAQQRGQIIDEKNPEKAARAMGVEDFISKPFTTEVLVAVLKDVVKRSRKVKSEESE